MRMSAAFVLVFSCLFGSVDAARPFIAVLGIAQDAGIPQMGCETPFCNRARENSSLRQMVASLALVDPDSGERWIFDATPDLPEQFDLLKTITNDRTNRLDGIFLTHAHIGHYTGLMYLGRESMNAKETRVFAMPKMREFLSSNGPWLQLVSIKNISLVAIDDGKSVELNERISVTPFLVPHRDEFSETVGYRIKSKYRTAIFIPDIDKWEKFSTPLESLVREADVLFIDGTFYADGEISRPISEVPHPFVSETVERLKGLPKAHRAKVVFIHFNHSNPLVQGAPNTVSAVERRGFRIARTGMKIEL